MLGPYTLFPCTWNYHFKSCTLQCPFNTLEWTKTGMCEWSVPFFVYIINAEYRRYILFWRTKISPWICDVATYSWTYSDVQIFDFWLHSWLHFRMMRSDLLILLAFLAYVESSSLPSATCEWPWKLDKSSVSGFLLLKNHVYFCLHSYNHSFICCLFQSKFFIWHILLIKTIIIPLWRVSLSVYLQK